MATPCEHVDRRASPSGSSRPRLERPVRGRVVGGVCAGLSEHLRMPVRHLRVAFAVAVLAGGAGAIAYAFLWAVTPESDDGPGRQAPAAARAGRLGGNDEAARNVLLGALLIVAGLVAAFQSLGLDLRLGVLVPMLAIGVGAVLAWSRLDDPGRGRWLTRTGYEREGLTRLGLGIALASIGVIALATQGRGLAGLWDVGLAALAVLAGAAFIAAPWAVRLWDGLREEQTERIRETERADLAAHLHDSVLQTLALIQRRSGDPAEVSRLARAQERELRGWLYAGPPGARSTLASAVAEAAHDVEDLQGVPIELVVTGDRPLDEGGAALVRAVREAMFNAVRHGRPPVSAYVEVGGTAIEAFVRDHGAGYDLDTVPEDRLGVRESIIGRMARHGGTARLRRLENGTEVVLALPLASAPTPNPQEPAGPVTRHTDSPATRPDPTAGGAA